MRIMPILRLALPLLGLALADAARADGPLVNADWLAQRLDDPKLVLLHVGDKDAFDKGHIAGARPVDGHMDFSDPDSHHGDHLTLEMPATEYLQDRLRGLGIDDDSTIVIYFAEDQITPATRVLFTLGWAGLGANTHLLDGGLDAWRAHGGPVSTEPTAAREGNVRIAPERDRIVDADWVEHHADSDGYRVLDARARTFYDGISRSNGRSGHIPGSGSLPWTDLVDPDLRFHDLDTLRRRFDEAGVRPGDTVAVYCHIGQYATAVILAARLLGHPVKLYDGAFQDWARRDLPVTREG